MTGVLFEEGVDAAVMDSYRLSPMQQGMLYHHLTAPGSGVDLEQIVCTLPEAVDAARLEGAWRRVVERHAILRTVIRWEGEPEPVQAVLAHVSVAIETQDLRTLAPEEQRAEVARFLAADRAEGFRFDRAPLMRLHLFRTAAAAYQLVWSFPHILLDGSSFPTVLAEVFALYDAAVRGEPEPALPAPRPFRAYIDWLARRDASGDEAYWRGVLAGFAAPTPVGLALPGGAAAAPSRGEHETRLSAATTARLRELARAHEITLNTFLLGAWGALLARYSREEDVVFGTTRAGRRTTGIPGADDIAGMFITTTPVRVRATPGARLVPWLRELRAAQTAVGDREHAALLDIQRWSEVPRGTTLFDSLIVFDRVLLDTAVQALARANGRDWSVRHFRLIDRTNFPLTLNAYGEPELLLRLSYDRPRFDDDSARRMLGSFARLLEGMAEAVPERAETATVGTLPMLTGEERRQLLGAGQASEARYAADRCIHELVEAQAARTPDAPAVTFEGEHLTYRELDERANRLAHFLRARGVGPEVLVGMYMERSLELIVGILGVLKAGGAYVPLDPAYPAERLAFMLEDARVPVLLTQTAMLARLPAAHQAEVVLLDEAARGALLAAYPAEKPRVEVTPANLAYVIYTSGSTGKPKGVLIPHSNVVRLFTATEQWYHFGERDVWTMFHSYAFDFSVWEIWGALFYGGRVVVVPYAVSRSPEDFYRLLARERVTVLNQTPSAFRQLVQYEETAAAAERLPLALRYVIFGGEALDFQSLLPWFARHGDRAPRLINMYGITETTVHVTYYPVTEAEARAGKGSSVVGRPIPDLAVYLLDPQLQPVPVGVPGEMFVGGAGVARGYLNRPELTAQRFVPDPFSGRPGATLYRSGDLARFLPSGDLDYLGRTDLQVKIRGFRIELGEIEAVVETHPAVAEAVVVARADGGGEKRLVAYVVSHPTVNLPSGAVLREHVRAALPEYMVPAFFVPIPAVPLTPNGKVDAKALPAPDARAQGDGRAVAPPRDEVERRLAAVWARVLDVSPVGAEDNFFDLGGHSFLAIRLFAEIQREFGRKLPLAALIQAPTVRRLAELLRSDAPTAANGSAPAAAAAAPTLFFVPTAGGEMLGYRQLIARLPADQPWAALLPPERGAPGCPPFDRIEELAMHYTADLQRRQPHGPYYLLGWCVGGVVAYEMAQQLRIRGERVALLMLVDANFPRVTEPSLAERLVVYQRQMRRMAPLDAARFAVRELTRVAGGRLRARPASNDSVAKADAEAIEEAHVASDALAARRYHPRPYEGRLTLVWPSERPALEEAFVDSRAEWTRVARGGAEHHDLTGSHHSIFLEPQAETLAGMIMDCLRRARAAEEAGV